MESGVYLMPKKKEAISWEDYTWSHHNSKYPNHFQEKVPYYDDFLGRFAKSTIDKSHNKLIYFALFLEENYNISMLEADVEHVLDFFKNDINKRDIIRESKQKWREFLNSYYKYVKEIKEKKEKKVFINPIPSNNLFEFEERPLTKEELEVEPDLLTYRIIERILNYLYFTRRRLFIIVLILLYSGARIFEIMHIEIDNIDFEERYIFTKIKSKKALNRYGIYFFPKSLIPFLQDWIKNIKEEYNNPKYLFPRGNTHLSDKTPRGNLRKVKNELGLTCKMNPHAFRDFINSERFDTKLKEKYRFLLLNQTPPNVNVKSYLKKYKKRILLLEKYDQFFPFPEFKPKLDLM